MRRESGSRFHRMDFRDVEDMEQYQRAHSDEFEIVRRIDVRLHRKDGEFLGECVSHVEGPLLKRFWRWFYG